MQHILRGGQSVTFFGQNQVPGAFFEMAKNLDYKVYVTGNNGFPTHSIFISPDDMIALMGLSGATDEQIECATSSVKIALDSLKWGKPREVTRIDVAFGNTKNLLPHWNEIPKDFQRERTPWNELAVRWWTGGLRSATFTPKEGIDQLTAKAHIATILRSFDPSSEHKLAAVAWLMSLWFDEVRP